jgi:hypothetical protein
MPGARCTRSPVCSVESGVAWMEPTGRREAPPDDRLRAIRDRDVRETAPDFASLHPGYGCLPIAGAAANKPALAQHRLLSLRRRHHKFLPSITVTGTASRSKSSSSRELTPTRGFSKSGLPVDQSGDSE